MANEIRLTVGDWVAVVAADDTQAVIDLLIEYETYYGLDATPAPEVRLQNMLEHLVEHIQTVALAQRQTAAQQAAAEAAEAEAPKWAA